jgi:hypothetical protein
MDRKPQEARAVHSKRLRAKLPVTDNKHQGTPAVLLAGTAGSVFNVENAVIQIPFPGKAVRKPSLS